MAFGASSTLVISLCVFTCAPSYTRVKRARFQQNNMLLLIKASLWSCFCLLEDVAAHFTSHTALKILVFKAIHLQPCGKAFAPFLIFFFFP